MLSRSLGVVTGATLLTLVFHSFETLGPANEAFLSGFRATFRLAAAVCAAASLAALTTRFRR
jgi:hypothetical protein